MTAKEAAIGAAAGLLYLLALVFALIFATAAAFATLFLGAPFWIAGLTWAGVLYWRVSKLVTTCRGSYREGLDQGRNR